MKRKLLSILLTLAMALTLLPVSAMAEGAEAPAGGEPTPVETKTGNVTYSEDGAKIGNLVYTNGTMTVTGANVTIENVTFGDGAALKVNTSGNFTLKNCTFNGKTDVRTPVTLNVGSATVTGNTFNGTKTDGTPAYYNAIEFAVNSGNKLSSATLSDNIFEAAIKNNYFSTYYYEDNAVITAENNVIKLANRGSNAIRISNVTNSDVTFNLNNNSYTYVDNTSDYEGFILLQDFTKKSGNAEDFSKVTINISNLTSPSDASRLFYVWEDSVGLVSDNNPVIKGDSSIEKFFAAKVGDTYYKSLSAAVAEIHTKTDAERAQHYDIELLKDATGGGFGIGYAEIKNNATSGNNPVNFTIKMNGHTYTMTTPTVGSKGTETNGIQLLMNSNVTFEGGTIEVDPNLRVAYLFQNYANLTLKDMNIDISAQPYCQAIVHPMHGIVNILGNTNLTNVGTYSWTYADNSVETGDKYAIMVMDWNNNSYGAGTQVTVKTLGIITGIIHTGYYGGDNITSTSGKSWLKIESGYFNGTFSQEAASEGRNFVAPSISISGGYFTSDPTAYLAAGKGLVTSDQNAFAYKVGDKATDVETAVTAGEAAVTIPEGVTGITEAAVKNAAKAADTTKTLTDTVAASGMTNDPAVVGTKEAAEAALSAKNISVGSGDTVTVVVQPYLEVNVKSADAGKLTLEISAKYNVVATTGSPVTIDPDKTATLKSGVPLSINKPIELTIVLPTGFAAGNSKIYVQHKGYEYTATVDASGATATFINPHGFSTFTVTPTASAVAEVDGTNYTDLQKAVDAVSNNGTVKLLNDTSASAVVSRAVKFTLDKNSKSFTGAITAGSGYELSVDGNVYTFTVRSSSGSSGSSSYDPTYSVSTPSKTEHGTVTVSPKSASKGDTVTVTVKPDSGYVLETLTVTDKNGNELTLKDKGNGKYTFTMPAGKVEVKATFMEDNSMLNFFYDVPNGAYFYEAVKWAVKNGITTGVGDNLFAPEQPCTRAQIVTFLWRAAGSPEPKGAASGMTDVVSGSYYEKAVAWAIENGITTGTTTSTFSPDATCTRAQAVTFLARALKAKAASAAEFSDVPTGSYFADAVAWAAANGVTEGIGGGLFGSDNDCTRGQIVTFLYRAYNK